MGGMSAVQPCNDQTLERKVAIKILPGGADQRRMRDEVSALLRMRSKHVVQVYDILKWGKADLALVQEFIEGKDLFDESIAPTDMLSYLKLIWQIACGISEIHSFKVIHRDIKPNNMMIDHEGVLKIFDFGLARDAGPAAATVGFIGTRGFAAPELYNQNVAFTEAVDIYAFAATALFVALRSLPEDLVQQPPQPASQGYFRQTQFELPEEITELLDRCLAAVPSDRPPMSTVRDTLAKHLLRNRHKALVVFQGKPSYLDKSNRNVSLTLANMGKIAIEYDGFSFRVTRLEGDVYINSLRAEVGHELPGACVVTLGAPEQASKRRYVTFDLSHPEIVL